MVRQPCAWSAAAGRIYSPFRRDGRDNSRQSRTPRQDKGSAHRGSGPQAQAPPLLRPPARPRAIDRTPYSTTAADRGGTTGRAIAGSKQIANWKDSLANQNACLRLFVAAAIGQQAILG